MTITNGYCTLPQLASALSIGDQQDDAELERAIGAASRWIDKLCGRRFYLDSGVTARVFRPVSSCLVLTDDFATATGLIVKTDPNTDLTFTDTWTAADFELEPINGIGPAGQPWPYYALRRAETLAYPTAGRASVQVTAKWGWPAVPDDITVACIRLAAFVFRTKDSPLGVAAFTDLGALRARTPSVVLDLITGYEREMAYGAPMVG